MKLNLTTLMIVALVAFVGWKFVKPALFDKNAAKGGNTSSPDDGRLATSPPDVAGSIINAVSSIFTAVGAVAQSSQKTN